MDPELEQLYKELDEVQNTSVVNKISQDNVVELVSKLMSEKRIDLIAYFYYKQHSSHSGARSLLTWSELEREIYEEIEYHDGRLTIEDIETSLNVDISYVSKCLETIMKNDKDVFQLGQEIITRRYLNSVYDSIHDMIRIKNVMNISEIAKITELMDFLIDVPTDLQNYFKADQDLLYKNDCFYLATYLYNQQCYIKGIVDAIEKPTNIQELATIHSLPFATLTDTIHHYLNENPSRGTLNGFIYTPSIYSHIQSSYCLSFFNENKYIPFTLVKQYKIHDIHSFLTNFDASISLVDLASCVIDHSFIDDFEVYLDEILKEEDSFDIYSYFPVSFTEEDIEMIVKHLKCISLHYDPHTLCFLIGKNYILKSKCVAQCMKEISKDAEVTIKKYIAAHPPAKESMNEEDDDTSSKKKKKSKSTKQSKSSATYAFLPTEEQIGEIIQSVYISFFHSFYIDEIFTDLQSILCLQAKHDYIELYDKYSKEVSSVGVVNFKLEMKKISTAMEEWWMNYQLYIKFLQCIEENQELHSLYLRPLYQLIKSNLILILNYFLLQNNINAVQSCTLKEINALLKPLPKDLNEYLSSLYTKYYSNKYNESYINDYYDLYLHMNEFGGPLFRVIDRKQTRQVLHGNKVNITQSLSSITFETVSISILYSLTKLYCINILNCYPYVDEQMDIHLICQFLKYLISKSTDENVNKEQYYAFIDDLEANGLVESNRQSLFDLYTFITKK